MEWLPEALQNGVGDGCLSVLAHSASVCWLLISVKAQMQNRRGPGAVFTALRAALGSLSRSGLLHSDDVLSSAHSVWMPGVPESTHSPPSLYSCALKDGAALWLSCSRGTSPTCGENDAAPVGTGAGQIQGARKPVLIRRASHVSS